MYDPHYLESTRDERQELKEATVANHFSCQQLHKEHTLSIHGNVLVNFVGGFCWPIESSHFRFSGSLGERERVGVKSAIEALPRRR
jgi:hypothetical protein